VRENRVVMFPREKTVMVRISSIPSPTRTMSLLWIFIGSRREAGAPASIDE
jgi:hypothetical protein